MAKRSYDNRSANTKSANDQLNKRQRRDSHQDQLDNGKAYKRAGRAASRHPWPFHIINQSMQQAAVPLSSTNWPKSRRSRWAQQTPCQPHAAGSGTQSFEGGDVRSQLENLNYNVHTLEVKVERDEDESLMATMFGYPKDVSSDDEAVKEQIDLVTEKSRKRKREDLLSKAAVAEMLLPFIDLEDPDIPTTVYAYGEVGQILLEELMLDEEAELECTWDDETGSLSCSLIGFDLPWAYYEDECGFRLAFLQTLRDHKRRPYVRLTDAHEADLERTFKDGGVDYVTTLLYVEEQAADDARDIALQDLMGTFVSKLDRGRVAYWKRDTPWSMDIIP